MNPNVERWLTHIRTLSVDIGPRGPTTEGERLGASYCDGVLRQLSLRPQVEGFTSARSIFQPHLIAASVLLIAFVIYPLAGRASAVLAALISLIALASDLLELGFIDNPLRRVVAKGRSQNVVAIAPAAGEHRRDLVLIGHIDTQRTPLVFSTARWVAIYKAFTTIAFALFAMQVVLYWLGAFTGQAWIWPATVPSALGALLLAAMCIEADRSPFTAGANDNASAVGLVLTLAEVLVANPLPHTRVWLTCTGCEEVQHYGAIDFFRRHRSEMLAPSVIAFEMLGCAGPSWLTREGIVVPFHASPDLVRLAESVAAQQPELAAYPAQINGGNTEMADALRLGIPAITIGGQTCTGDLPFWHQVGDTYDKMDPETLGRAYDFTWAFITALDARSSDVDIRALHDKMPTRTTSSPREVHHG